MARDDETEHERLDRNLEQLLNELRVAMPGVQLLFGFLLTVPFQQRFAEVTDFQQNLYFATLLCAMTASAFFIAPTAYHRIAFRKGEKTHLVFTATKLAIAGLVALALAMIGAVILITDVLFRDTTVVVVGACATALYAWLWFGFPLMRRARG